MGLKRSSRPENRRFYAFFAVLDPFLDPSRSWCGWSPVFVHFGSGSPSLGEVLTMMVNEFAFAISTVHFRTLRKWIKAISEVQADWATANTSPKGGDPICPKIQYSLRAQGGSNPAARDHKKSTENGKVRYSLCSRKSTRKLETHIYSLGISV